MKYLILFVEEETEVCEDDPQFLPAIAVLELAQQISTQLILIQYDTHVIHVVKS